MRELFCRIEFFFEELAFVEVGVVAVEAEEFLVRAAFDDAAFVEDADDVGVADRRYAVRDDQRCSILADVAEIMEDRFLGVRVNGGERIVEDQDPRVAHHGTGDGGSLLLATGERDAAFAYELFVLAGHFLDVGGQAGDVGGAFDGHLLVRTASVRRRLVRPDVRAAR